MEVKASAKATGFVTQQTSDCYLGIQQRRSTIGYLEGMLGLNFGDPDEYKSVIIFAAWNPCTVEEIGPDANWENYGEGSSGGCKVQLPARWGNMEHDFVTTTESMSDGRMKMTAYWKGDGDWELVGSIIKPSGSGITSFSSFLEQFGASMFEGDDLRAMELGPHLVESATGTWQPLTSATYTTQATSQAGVYTVGSLTADGARWMLGVTGKSGQGLTSKTPDQTRLTLTAQPTVPAALTAWQAKRDSGTLPTGCVGCGDSPIFNYFEGLKDRFVPMNSKQAAFEVLLLLVPVAGLWVGVWFWHQQRQKAAAGQGYPGLPGQVPMGVEGRPLMAPC